LLYWNWGLNSVQWRYDDQCKGRQECYFTVKVEQTIPINSIGFIYLKDFTQANKRYQSIKQIPQLEERRPAERSGARRLLLERALLACLRQ
jgi:hypothetical protein